MPTAHELQVDVQPFLNGMAEAANELRRQILDCLRVDDRAEAERLLAVMDASTACWSPSTAPMRSPVEAAPQPRWVRGARAPARGDVTTAMVASRLRAAVEGAPPHRQGVIDGGGNLPLFHESRQLSPVERPTFTNVEVVESSSHHLLAQKRRAIGASDGVVLRVRLHRWHTGTPSD
jgi:hypothetical protein